MTQPILSICIPTFNRAKYLEETLTSFTNEEVFKNTEQIEIIISDNCSTDNTKQIAMGFIAKYSSKIKYFCNDENIHDCNFEKTLSRGSGKFLKLNNDTLAIRSNYLGKMLDFIKEHEPEKPLLFFLNNTLKTKENITKCSNLDEFLQTVSFQASWIGGFGIWKNDFDKLQDFSREAKHSFAQTDVLCRLLSEKGKIAIVNNTPFQEIQQVKNKGGETPAKVFGYYFPLVLKKYLQKGSISQETYNKVIKDMFQKVLIFSQFHFKLNVPRNGYWKYTKEFHNKLYFYTAFLKIPFIITLTSIPKDIFYFIPKRIRNIVYNIIN